VQNELSRLAVTHGRQHRRTMATRYYARLGYFTAVLNGCEKADLVAVGLGYFSAQAPDGFLAEKE
jgi:hypothetical protein